MKRKSIMEFSTACRNFGGVEYRSGGVIDCVIKPKGIEIIYIPSEEELHIIDLESRAKMKVSGVSNIKTTFDIEEEFD